MVNDSFLAFQPGLDLNLDPMTYGLLHLHAMGQNELQQICFLSTHGVSAFDHS